MRFSALLCAAAASSVVAMPASPILALEDLKLNTAILSLGKAFDVVPQSTAQTASAKKPAAHTEAFSAQAAAEAAPGACAAGSIVTRVEWRAMSSADKSGFLKAVNCLMDAPSKTGQASRYEDLAAVHIAMVNQIHQVATFLPWHRGFLFAFQSILRNECSYRGPLPWWDETLDSGRYARSPLFSGAADSFGSLPLNNRACITNGAFARRQVTVNGQRTCLYRQGDESDSRQVTSSYVSTCNSRTNYPDHESCNEYGPHGYGHNAVGGLMGNTAASPLDPVFFLHHGFVDRMWARWQGTNNNRLTQVSGCANRACSQSLTPDTMLRYGGLIPDIPVSQVINPGNSYLCYRYS